MKVLIFSCCLFAAFTAHSQDYADSTSAEKRIQSGFLFGTNHSKYHINYDLVPQEERSTGSPGFHLGVFADFRLTKKLHFRPVLQLSFLNKYLVQTVETTLPVQPETASTLDHRWDFVAYGPGKLKNGYLAIGPELSIVLEEGETTFTRHRVEPSAAIGWKFDLKHFHIIPELRYSAGVSNQAIPYPGLGNISSNDKAYLHKMFFTVIFQSNKK